MLLEDGTRLTGLSAVILAQGHVPARPTAAERRLAAFAARHGLTYLAPSNPADADLTSVGAGEPVLLRGLGLNFFDYMALFTHGRGGTFARVDGRLRYRPSGREPRLYAGSRRGVPYHARGDNEKGAHGRHLPRLLTARHAEALRTTAGRPRPVRFGTDLWPLIAKEVQSVYYETLLTARGHTPPRWPTSPDGTCTPPPAPRRNTSSTPTPSPPANAGTGNASPAPTGNAPSAT